MPVLTLITHVISSVHGTFCGSCIEQFDIKFVEKSRNFNNNY